MQILRLLISRSTLSGLFALVLQVGNTSVWASTTSKGSPRDSANSISRNHAADRKWYRADDSIHLPDEYSSTVEILLIVDNMDATYLLRQDQYSGSLYFIPRELLILPGKHKILIYAGPPGAEKRLKETIEVGILDSLGMERSEFDPTGSIEVGYQPYLTSRGTALPPPSPAEFADLDYKIGFASEVQRSSWNLKTTQNWVGTTRETKALRFSELGAEAPHLDLSDYNMTLDGPTTKLEVGNITGMEQNPLLIQNISNRGLYLAKRYGSMLSASITAQSGRSMTGYNYLLGFNQEYNNIYSAQVSIEPFLIPKHLRLGFSWLRSQQPAVADFGIGQVPSAESSDGLGLSISSSILDDRLVANLAYASSAYSAPRSREVDEFGSESIFLAKTRNQAFKGEIQVALAPSQNPYASSLKLSIGQYDPEYKIVSGFSESDKKFWDVSLDGKVNSVSYSLASGSFRDNIDNKSFMLSTRNDYFSASVGIPLHLVFFGTNSGKPGTSWLPDISAGYSYGGQYGINNPVTDPGAAYYFEGQIPRLYTSSSRLGLSWNLDPASITFSYNNIWQNNQQQELKNRDVYNNSFELALSWPISSSLTISPRLLYTKELTQSPFVETRNLQHGLDIAYQAADALAVSAGYNYGNQSVSSGVSSMNTLTIYGQVSYMFSSLLGQGTAMPGSIFLRLNYSSQSQVDSLSSISNVGSNFWVNTGFSVKLF